MRVLLAVLAMAVVLFPLPARAIDVWGDQSGTWTRDNSPYNVIGEIRVPPESTLVIEPGVVVNFQGHYKFIVDNSATLLAVGTEADSIYFTTDDPHTGWHGIRFLSASSNSQMTYCHLQYGKATGYGEDGRGRAIYCSSSSPTISSSTITENYAEERGGGIYCYNSDANITGNTVSSNSVSREELGYRGAGIYCEESDPVITSNTIEANHTSYNGGGICLWYCGNASTIANNLIRNNSTVYGGGIYCKVSSPTIERNTISDNFAVYAGAGINLFDRSSPIVRENAITGNRTGAYGGGGVACGTDACPLIENNFISGNISPEGGGGVFCQFGSSAIITNNTIVGNRAGWGGGIHCKEANAEIIGNSVIGNNADFSGGGIHSHNCSPTITHNCVIDNTAMRYGGGISCRFCNSAIANNTVSGNTAYWGGGGLYTRDSSPRVKNSIFWGDSAPEIQVDPSGYPTITYCDVQGGWSGQGNISADPLFVDPGAGDFHLQWGSPCIDTGDPNSAPDPDGTRADMGAFYFAHGIVFSPREFLFNLQLDTIAEKVLSLENVGDDSLFFRLSSDIGWISFLPDSGYLAPDSSLDVSVTFDGTDLPLGPNKATIYLEAVTSNGTIHYEISVKVYIFSLEYTYVALYPDSLPIVIPPEGGSFNCWAQVYNSSDFLYRFDIWIDVTLPDGTTHGPRFKRENFRFRPRYSESRHLTQNVPAYAPPGEYSYNFKMGVFPDQVDYQDSFSFTKLEVGLLPDLARVTSWDLYGWDEELVTYLGQGHDPKRLGPTEYSLSQNYPNPFNATTTINYRLPADGYVSLEVYNVFGQKVATLVDETQEAGYESAVWDASSVSSGLYFYRLSAGDYTETRRMMLVK